MATPFIQRITLWGYSSPLNTIEIASFGYLTGTPTDGTITNYVARAKQLIIEEFQEHDNIDAWLTSLANQSQEVEFMLQDLKNLLWINTAGGEQLDGNGNIVGETRQGRTDDEYREAIALRIGINTCNGTPDSIMSLTKQILDSAYVLYNELYPARIILQTQSTPSDITIFASLNSLIPGGVGLEVYNSFSDFAFGFDGDAEALGLSEINYTVGGQPIGGNFTERMV